MKEKFISDIIENKLHSDFEDVFLSNTGLQAVSFVNPFSYGILADNISLVNELDYLFSDGSLLCALSNLRRDKKLQRVSFDFSSIADRVFQIAESRSLPVALVGASNDEIQLTVDFLSNAYPQLNICYARDGYFNQSEFQQVIKEVDNSQAQILISGMGTPLQEEFIVHAKANSQVLKFAFTCGGFLTQTSLRGDYYMPLVKKLGLRWLQRCIMHSHVRKRLLKDYPLFVISYLLNRRL